METTDAFTGLECRDCGALVDPGTGSQRCEDCGGRLDPTYDYDAIDLDRDRLAARPEDSMWRYRELLPFARETAVTMNEGATPIVDCADLADELGVERVVIKDEGRNPTGTVRDRGASVAVTAAAARGASDVALPSTGDGGQAVAAYAARAGLESHAYLPSRSSHTTKSMVNVHGGDMTVAGGRYDDAAAAFADASEDHDDWHSLSAFDTPYRHEGAKTLLFELVEQLAWTPPDAIVVPTGHGVGVVAAYRAATELRALGFVEELPALYAAQSSGCAPIVDAHEAGRDGHEPVETPDTICGGIEIPDPDASPRVLEALRETGGGGVATDDDEILEAGVAVAQHEGLEMAPSSAAAASGAWALAEAGVFDGDETVAIVNAGTGNKEADVLRSHLMTKGV